MKYNDKNMSNQFSIFTELDQNIKIVSYIYDAIKITLGPIGKGGLCCSNKGKIVSLSSSSDVLKSFEFSSKKSNVILKLLESASTKTLKLAGGGSTATTLLLCKILMNSLRFLLARYNRVQISSGLNRISYFLKNQLEELTFPIKTNSQLESIIKTAAGQKLSVDLVSLLCEALFALKRDGLLFVEEVPFSASKIENVNGIELDAGFASSYFINDLKNFEVNYKNPYLLILEKPLLLNSQIKEIIDFILKENVPLVIIAEFISEEVLSSLVLSTIKKKLRVVAIKYKPIKFIKTGLLDDLALLAHSSYAKENKNQCSLNGIGQVDQVIIKKNTSNFILSKFTKIVANRRINELNRELLLSETDYEKNNFKIRIARLSSNIIKLKLGESVTSKSSDDMKKIQNLILTLNGALEEGCLPGGGAIYLHLKEELKNWSYLNLIGEEIYSTQIISDALITPFLELLENSNISKGSLIEQVSNTGYPFSYCLHEKEIIDAFNTGLIDSAKQIRLTLCNSISMSSSIIASA